MRIGELSRHTGIPVPTIKYYLREGLVPAGVRTSPNQAQYDERHVRRIRLVRALVEVGGLSISVTREVLAEMDAPDRFEHDLLGKVLDSMYRTTEPRTDAAWETATRQANEVIDRREWLVAKRGPARHALIEVFAALNRLGEDDLLGLMDLYSEVAERVAAAEIALIGRRTDMDGLVEGAVIGTVLGERAIAALRRLAQADASARAFRSQHPAEPE